MKKLAEEESTENDLAARLVTLQLLEQVLDRKTTLDIALDNSAEFADLSVRDRAFSRMLLTTTLRRLGQIDDLITFAQDRPQALRSIKILHILRLGVTQIFFMGVADHASVDTSVRLTEYIGADKQKGFVNAVLRRLLREGEQRLQNQDAARINTPEWVLKSWIADYGLGTAAAIAQANLNEAPLDITVKDKADRAYWANVLKATELPTGTLRRMGGGNIRELDGFDEGKWWIQDASAAIPANLLGDINGAHVVDLCAAPGGKTLQMAGMGANVTAIDRSAQRLKRLEENLIRMDLKEKVQVAVADATIWMPPADPVQYILLDAPCSATGTVRRHPDTLYLKTPDDIVRLTIIQEKLLHHASDILAVGGVLVYCTCSLQKDEGERQIEKFLKKRPKMKRVAITAEEVGGHGELIDENGDLRILPSHLPAHGGMDGFFAARLTKIK